MDLIRTLLLRLEAFPMEMGEADHVLPDDDRLSDVNATPVEIEYHLSLLRDQGLLACPDSQGMTGVIFTGLTWSGHDFVDSVRDEEIWRKTKLGAEQTGAWTFDIIKDLAKGFIKTQIKKYTEVEI
jgi:Hypothetical protein (DUF2513)